MDAPAFDAVASARQALACLDLTSLDDADRLQGGEADIAALCARASGRHGRVAAVCVWPRLARFARGLLPPEVAVAAVANFPDGGSDIARAVRDTAQIVEAGAQEVDVVIPYRGLAAAPKLLAAVRLACEGLKLKVILETGELADAALITQASRIALAEGADFLKTSTGKTPTSASLAAATLMLQSITADPSARARVGIKPSGGIRSVVDAAAYVALAAQHLGADQVGPARFRIGASGLLDDIEAVLGGAASGSVPPGATGGRY